MASTTPKSNKTIIKDYTPTTVELNTSIAAIVKAKPYFTAKDVSAQLKKEHPTWKLPDRRITKFVKRIKSGSPMTADDDKSIGSTRSLGSRLFASKPKKATAVATTQKAVQAKKKVVAPPKKVVAAPAVVKEDDNSILPASTVDTDVTGRSVDFEQHQRNLMQQWMDKVYYDDNDGTKKFHCFCLGN